MWEVLGDWCSWKQWPRSSRAPEAVHKGYPKDPLFSVSFTTRMLYYHTGLAPEAGRKRKVIWGSFWRYCKNLNHLRPCWILSHLIFPCVFVISSQQNMRMDKTYWKGLNLWDVTCWESCPGISNSMTPGECSTSEVVFAFLGLIGRNSRLQSLHTNPFSIHLHCHFRPVVSQKLGSRGISSALKSENLVESSIASITKNIRGVLLHTVFRQNQTVYMLTLLKFCQQFGSCECSPGFLLLLCCPC